MKARCKLLVDTLFLLLVFLFISTNSIFAQGLVDKNDPSLILPETPMPNQNRDYWQEGWDYGFALGKYYATSGLKETISVYDGFQDNGWSLKFKTVVRIQPLIDYYQAMGNAFYYAKYRNAELGIYDMFTYFDGAINGLYDGFSLYRDGSGSSGGSGSPSSPPKDGGPLTENPHEP